MSGFRLGRLLSGKPPMQRCNQGRRMRTHALMGGAAVILAVGGQFLFSPAAHAQPIPGPGLPAPSIPGPSIPGPDPGEPGPDPVDPLPIPVPDLPTPPGACLDPGTEGVFWFHVCAGQPRLPQMVTRLETGLDILGANLSVSDARDVNVPATSIMGGCVVAFTPQGDADSQSEAGPSVSPDSARSETANSAASETTNSSTADGVVPTAFTEATRVSLLPSDGGLPAVGGAVGLATAPLGHSDSSGIVNQDESHGGANASWPGLAFSEDVHS